MNLNFQTIIDSNNPELADRGSVAASKINGNFDKIKANFEEAQDIFLPYTGTSRPVTGDLNFAAGRGIANTDGRQKIAVLDSSSIDEIADGIYTYSYTDSGSTVRAVLIQVTEDFSVQKLVYQYRFVTTERIEYRTKIPGASAFGDWAPAATSEGGNGFIDLGDSPDLTSLEDGSYTYSALVSGGTQKNYLFQTTNRYAGSVYIKYQYRMSPSGFESRTYVSAADTWSDWAAAGGGGIKSVNGISGTDVTLYGSDIRGFTAYDTDPDFILGASGTAGAANFISAGYFGSKISSYLIGARIGGWDFGSGPVTSDGSGGLSSKTYSEMYGLTVAPFLTVGGGNMSGPFSTLGGDTPPAYLYAATGSQGSMTRFPFESLGNRLTFTSSRGAYEGYVLGGSGSGTAGWMSMYGIGSQIAGNMIYGITGSQIAYGEEVGGQYGTFFAIGTGSGKPLSFVPSTGMGSLIAGFPALNRWDGGAGYILANPSGSGASTDTAKWCSISSLGAAIGPYIPGSYLSGLEGSRINWIGYSGFLFSTGNSAALSVPPTGIGSYLQSVGGSALSGFFPTLSEPTAVFVTTGATGGGYAMGKIMLADFGRLISSYIIGSMIQN